MVTLFEKSFYCLVKTKSGSRLLCIERGTFTWVDPETIGEMRVATHTPHTTDYVIRTGRYRLYDVKDEPPLAGLQHLELEYGPTDWHGYLLLTGLPRDQEERTCVVPTPQIITGSARDVCEDFITVYRQLLQPQ
jgi:hypothetical protein